MRSTDDQSTIRWLPVVGLYCFRGLKIDFNQNLSLCDRCTKSVRVHLLPSVSFLCNCFWYWFKFCVIATSTWLPSQFIRCYWRSLPNTSQVITNNKASQQWTATIEENKLKSKCPDSGLGGMFSNVHINFKFKLDL